jgi:hypothetical protein
MLFLAAGLVITVLSGDPVFGQNAVLNPLFQTSDLLHWTGTDPTLNVVTAPPNLGLEKYCCRKLPGTPSNNGSLTQQVHLLGGHTYSFSANIAAKYCST